MSAALSARLARLADPATDTELLARFAAARDGDTFAELVRRHGPMVLAVCRRVTRHAHDADDAFQAAFLVLARKADRLGPRDRVAAWLYGVALRTARKACERRGREALVAAVPDVPERTAEPFDPDAARAVVEEVERLPSIFRAAVVLCELEGRPRAAAARELGIAEGTLSSRLALARKRLAARLAARGFAPARLAPVTVPPALASAASALGSGTPASPVVAALAHGACRAMVPRILAPGLLAVVTIALATGLLSPAPATTVAPAARAAAPLPEEAVRPGPIVLSRGRALVGIDPDGRNERSLLAWTDVWSPQWFAVAPNGTRVAVVHGKDTPDNRPGFRVNVRSLAADGPEGGTTEFPGWGHVIWSRDGTELAVTSFDVFSFIGGQGSARHVIMDVTTRAQTPLKLPEDHLLADWSRDGRYFLTVQNEARYGQWLWMMRRDGTAHKSLTGGVTSYCARFSPDGRRVLARVDGSAETTVQASRPSAGMALVLPRVNVPAETTPRAIRPQTIRLVSIDVATGAATHLADAPPGAAIHFFCWSPDGRRVAYILEGAPSGKTFDQERFSRVILCDADGRNPRTILSETATPEWAWRLPSQIDWR